jgi:glycosyltransferase involved in cell wall biosynthesis
MTRLRGLQVPHLAYAFNFTDLPTGLAHKTMARAYRQVSRFVVFSTLERELYARHFDLPIERFDMMHWAVQPRDASAEPPVEAGDYICALGSQARDYATLFQAMVGLPHIRLVVVAQPENLRDLTIPSNVSLYTAIPATQAANILAHSRFTVIPLRDSVVPCGHVTIVSAMHAGKAIVATESAGIRDYLKSGDTGALVPARDADALSQQISELYENPLAAGEMGRRALDFARLHCVESRVVERMAAYLAHGLDSR